MRSTRLKAIATLHDQMKSQFYFTFIGVLLPATTNSPWVMSDCKEVDAVDEKSSTTLGVSDMKCLGYVILCTVLNKKHLSLSHACKVTL